jgi:ATP-binding cassette subfamily B (MDR/TAP) protein 8
MDLATCMGPTCGDCPEKQSKRRELRRVWLGRYDDDFINNESSLINKSLSNIRTVRAFANEELERQHYDQALKEASQANQKLGYHIGIFQGMTNFSIGAMVLSVLYFGGNMVARQEMTSGDLMSYLISVQSTQKCLGNNTGR